MHLYLAIKIYEYAQQMVVIRIEALEIVFFYILGMAAFSVRYFRILKISAVKLNADIQFMEKVYPKRRYYLIYIISFLVIFFVSPFILRL
jgi:hypothetical protein